MDPKIFYSPESGRVVRQPTGYHAFIPALPPLDLSFDLELIMVLSRADAALGELSGLGRQLPNPHLLIDPLVRREAVLSSRIEGTQASLTDVFLSEAGQSDQSQVPAADVQEVLNYVAALEHGLTRLDSLPLSLRLLNEMHAKLMTGVRGRFATPGEFRRSQNWIGPAGSTPATATYVPPPHEELPDVLGAWEKYLHLRGVLPDLVHCALIHEHFEAIHPYLDGNGRIGRLLITLFLVERGRLSQPLLYLSDYIERNREDYYRLLLRVRTHGDYAAWVRYFLVGIEETARDAVRRVRKLIELRERLLLEDHGKGSAALISQLFVRPHISVSEAAKLMAVSQPTAAKVLQSLVAAGHLREITGRSRYRAYVARAILDALERSPA
ncbi:MAG: cell filamentation protein Fic [Opitutus sp.]|nr:cell filamentation protein Fic [Opitutus sp.]